MIPKLYEHQEVIIKANKLKCGLFLGTGASKTRTALEMAEGKTLVICPKQQRDDETWEHENKKWATKVNLTVVSKEDIRKLWDELPKYQTVIIDECHNNLGVTPDFKMVNREQVPKTSQIYEATINYVAKHNPKRLYLLSATPVPKPMCMWGIGQLFGQTWDYAAFRSAFYIEVRKIGRAHV